jgi:predicted ArsR family transcriptional regulator
MAIDESDGSLGALAPTRRAILEAIKRSGGMRAEELAEHLQITVSGVRQHLAAMQSEGFVAHTTVRGQPGRPKFVFHLTRAGERLFPKRYEQFATSLVRFIGEEDPALLQRAFRAREAERLARMLPRTEGLPLRERVAAVAAFYDDDGFLAEWSELPEGRFRLRQHNCPVLELARGTPYVCASEQGFLNALFPEADVELVHHMLGGEPVCEYEIRPRK